MPRLFRESPVNGIWEGSGNVIALDVLRTLRREPGALDAFAAELAAASGADRAFDAAVRAFGRQLSGTPEEADGRQIVERMALLLQAVAPPPPRARGGRRRLLRHSPRPRRRAPLRRPSEGRRRRGDPCPPGDLIQRRCPARDKNGADHPVDPPLYSPVRADQNGTLVVLVGQRHARERRVFGAMPVWKSRFTDRGISTVVVPWITMPPAVAGKVSVEFELEVERRAVGQRHPERLLRNSRRPRPRRSRSSRRRRPRRCSPRAARRPTPPRRRRRPTRRPSCTLSRGLSL